MNFLDAPCGTPANYLGDFFGTELVSAPFDTWICPTPVDFVAPVGALCIEFVAFLRNNGPTGTFEARFDDLELLPEPMWGGAVGVLAVAALAMLRGRRSHVAAWGRAAPRARP